MTAWIEVVGDEGGMAILLPGNIHNLPKRGRVVELSHFIHPLIGIERSYLVDSFDVAGCFRIVHIYFDFDYTAKLIFEEGVEVGHAFVAALMAEVVYYHQAFRGEKGLEGSDVLVAD